MPDIYHCATCNTLHCGHCKPVVLCDLDGTHCDDGARECRACGVEGGWAA